MFNNNSIFNAQAVLSSPTYLYKKAGKLRQEEGSIYRRRKGVTNHDQYLILNYTQDTLLVSDVRRFKLHSGPRSSYILALDHEEQVVNANHTNTTTNTTT